MGHLEALPGTELVLIRHGETAWNASGRVQGNLDVPLSERGREQSRLLGLRLRGEDFAAAYTSDLSRSRETAEIALGQGAALTLDERLREARFGCFEGLTRTEMAERYPEAFEAWRRDSVRHRPPLGEALECLQARCMAALAEYLPAYPGGKIVVFAHGGPMRVMLCGLLDAPLALYPRLRVENTAICRVLFGERGPMLAAWNDLAHLTGPSGPLHSGWEEK